MPMFERCERSLSHARRATIRASSSSLPIRKLCAATADRTSCSVYRLSNTGDPRVRRHPRRAHENAMTICQASQVHIADVCTVTGKVHPSEAA